eukprot:CAMPEP_0204267778 /NCGR_PEP_ID=MMETSP0468-20130131/11166_1 /ASSEMBLY_ACC=CAM_ASM_000383 /TAXON_ID=2969 /ORGANISM="Oxyrrhis marina" /LENGTH=299 /DNA_ID=CAMNT_0051242981 /DNA_START=71 /DNA_END=970 /DNA_ORIENTATION=+
MASNTCSVHGKTRREDYLETGMDGQIRCKTGFECKVPGGMGGMAGGMAGGMMGGMAGMGAGMGMGGMAGFGQQVMNTTSAPAGSCFSCFIHGKSRKVEFLEEYSDGLYKCKEGFECKGGGGPGAAVSSLSAITYMCSAHGKMRSVEALDEIMGADGNVAHQCKSTHTCKGSGAPYSAQPRMLGMGGKGGGMMTSVGQVPAGVPVAMWEQSVQQAAAALLGFPTGALGGAALGGYGGLTQLVGYTGMGAASAPATPRGGGGGGEGTARCRVHGKNRTLRNLQADPAAPGEYCCIASSSCQ